MTASMSTPMNFIGVAFDNLINDPATAQLSPLLAGVAMDMSKSIPVNLYSNIPHYETEVADNESGNPSGPNAGV